MHSRHCHILPAKKPQEDLNVVQLKVDFNQIFQAIEKIFQDENLNQIFQAVNKREDPNYTLSGAKIPVVRTQKMWSTLSRASILGHLLPLSSAMNRHDYQCDEQPQEEFLEGRVYPNCG